MGCVLLKLVCFMQLELAVVVQARMECLFTS